MVGVSVVIPCLNEEKYIASCLDGLISNGYDLSCLELIIVDGGSVDETLSIIEDYQDKYGFIKLVDNPQKKTPFALNLGIQNAKYNKVLIAGAHAIYPVNYINRLSHLLERTDIDVVGGIIETKVKHENSKTNAICYVLSHPLGVGNSTFRTGANELLEVDTVPFGLYSKIIFDAIGLYNERLIRNHDMELSSRIKQKGYRIWLEPDFRCTYFARETFNALAKNNYGNGLWNLKTLGITRKFTSLGLRHYIPMIFVLSLVLPAFAIPVLSVKVLWLAGISLSSYLLSVLLISIKARNNSFLYVFYTFIVLHFSYGFGSLVGAFSLLNIKK